MTHCVAPLAQALLLPFPYIGSDGVMLRVFAGRIYRSDSDGLKQLDQRRQHLHLVGEVVYLGGSQPMIVLKYSAGN